MADERFSGDMSRNEVEIDLNKFMELVTENSNLKAEILKLESEKEPENPWQRWIWLSNMVDSWRIFPRAFLSIYIFLLYYSTMWFMDLPDPTLEQSGLISIIVGAGAALLCGVAALLFSATAVVAARRHGLDGTHHHDPISRAFVKRHG